MHLRAQPSRAMSSPVVSVSPKSWDVAAAQLHMNHCLLATIVLSLLRHKKNPTSRHTPPSIMYIVHRLQRSFSHSVLDESSFQQRHQHSTRLLPRGKENWIFGREEQNKRAKFGAVPQEEGEVGFLHFLSLFFCFCRFVFIIVLIFHFLFLKNVPHFTCVHYASNTSVSRGAMPCFLMLWGLYSDKGPKTKRHQVRGKKWVGTNWKNVWKEMGK